MQIGWCVLFKQALAIVAKDMRVEFRTRYALNALLMFALVTLTAVSFTTSSSSTISGDTNLLSALFWIVLFFSTMTGASRSFVAEEDAHTAPLLRLSAGGTVVYWGKFAGNLMLLSVLGAVTFPLYVFLMSADVGNIGLHIVGIVLGTIGLSGGATIVAAIVAQSAVRGALFTALSFPVLLPFLVLAIQINAAAFAGLPMVEVYSQIMGLVAYSGVLITTSVLLFDFVWR